jgi:hypothetical protein
MEQEAAYLAVLPTAVQYRVDGGSLALLSADGTYIAPLIRALVTFSDVKLQPQRRVGEEAAYARERPFGCRVVHTRERELIAAKLDARDLIPPQRDLEVRRSRFLLARAQPEQPSVRDDDEPLGAGADRGRGAPERTDSLGRHAGAGEAAERLPGLPSRVVRQARDGGIDVGSIRGERF